MHWMLVDDAILSRADSVADPDGVQGVLSNPPPPPPPRPFLNIPWKWNNLVSMRLNYFNFIGYLRKWDKISKTKLAPTPLYMNPLSRNPGSAHVTAQLVLLSRTWFIVTTHFWNNVNKISFWTFYFILQCQGRLKMKSCSLVSFCVDSMHIFFNFASIVWGMF